MARNFRICTKENNNQTMNITLFGDFDASSACELIAVLDANVSQTMKVAIDTNGLRTINVFGLEVLLPRMSGLAKRRADIEIIGRFSSIFQEQ